MSDARRLCAIIPTHNHTHALPDTLARLDADGIPALVIDDGSAPAFATGIEAICGRFAHVERLRHSFNGGKGFAVMCGMARAAERGFTHAVQIDADGQHDLDDLPALLSLSEQNPEALIAGTPVYDASVPAARKWGRKLTNFWAGVNAATLDMPDAMCGFRVYPVESCLAVVRDENVTSRRMEFDTEILVASHWAGQRILPCPVHVTYPDGNTSNFDMLRDNIGLSFMHTRMFFGMLARAPRRIARALRGARADDQRDHWPEMRERGVYAAMYLLALVYRVLGPRVCRALLYPVAGVFFLTGKTARDASRAYLERAWEQGYLDARPTALTGFRHFLTFAEAAVDKFAAWTGRLSPDDVNGIETGPFRDAELAGGAFVITAHLGNPEVLRAIAGVTGRWRVNVLVHTAHAEMFNRMVERFSGQSTVRMTQVTEIGPATAIALAEAIERGEWVVMVADRAPVSRGGRTVDAPFMGGVATFPQGPYILASILKCPTYVMFCTKRGDGFDVEFEPFADPVRLPRNDREGSITAYATQFAEMMERQVSKTPMQWFNFYPYWKTGAPAPAPRETDT